MCIGAGELLRLVSYPGDIQKLLGLELACKQLSSDQLPGLLARLAIEEAKGEEPTEAQERMAYWRKRRLFADVPSEALLALVSLPNIVQELFYLEAARQLSSKTTEEMREALGIESDWTEGEEEAKRKELAVFIGEAEKMPELQKDKQRESNSDSEKMPRL